MTKKKEASHGSIEPIVVDGVEKWEVETILAEREYRKKQQVLVKWSGLDEESATWEPIGNIPQNFIDKFRSEQSRGHEGDSNDKQEDSR